MQLEDRFVVPIKLVGEHRRESATAAQDDKLVLTLEHRVKPTRAQTLDQVLAAVAGERFERVPDLGSKSDASGTTTDHCDRKQRLFALGHAKGSNE
jgi:hypothetical protein